MAFKKRKESRSDFGAGARSRHGPVAGSKDVTESKAGEAEPEMLERNARRVLRRHHGRPDWRGIP